MQDAINNTVRNIFETISQKNDISFNTKFSRNFSTSLSWPKMDNCGYMSSRFIDFTEIFESKMNTFFFYGCQKILAWRIHAESPEFSDLNFFQEPIWRSSEAVWWSSESV